MKKADLNARGYLVKLSPYVYVGRDRPVVGRNGRRKFSSPAQAQRAMKNNNQVRDGYSIVPVCHLKTEG